MSVLEAITFSLIGGLLPALFWLLFWIREDSAHPEPPKKIFLAFLVGGLSIIIVLPLQKIAFDYISSPLLIVIAWALFEEVAKFGAAYVVAIRTKVFDEPIDALIYLISAALGFAAIENVFFILNPALGGLGTMAALTINVRFIGASLLHVISSASIGVGLAYAWKKRRLIKITDFGIGLIIAVGLHSLFNLFILNIKGSGVIFAFTFVWISVVVLMGLFEAIKKMSVKNKQNINK